LFAAAFLSVNGLLVGYFGAVLHSCSRFPDVPRSGGAPQVRFIDVRNCSIDDVQQEKTMSTRDLPATVRAMSVIVAVALVATAFAPILFAAARVVA
jgi:hypothetical protein